MCLTSEYGNNGSPDKQHGFILVAFPGRATDEGILARPARLEQGKELSELL